MGMRTLLQQTLAHLSTPQVSPSKSRRRARQRIESLESRELLTQYFDYANEFRTLTAGASRSAGNAIATDEQGNTYVTGDFAGSNVDFDPTTAQNLLTSAGGTDIFVSKFDAAGTLVWNIVIGGTGDDAGLGIAVAGNGAVYVAGFFSATVDFDSGAGTQSRTSAGGKDGFLLQLNRDTGSLLVVHTFGSTGEDQATSVDAFASTNVVATGFFNGTVDFNPSSIVTSATSAGGDDAFLMEMTASLDLSNVIRVGGTGADRGAAVKYTPIRDILLTGSFSATANFNPRSTAVNITSSGLADAFVARYDSAMFLKWGAKAGGTQNDTGTGIDSDVNGKIVAVGNFDGTADFDPSAATSELVTRGFTDAFIATYDAFGALLGVQQVGGARSDAIRGLDIDNAGNRYILGNFEFEARFGRGNGNFPLNSPNSSDIFLAKLTATDTFLYAQQFSGSGNAVPGGLSLGTDARLSLTGGFTGTMDSNPGPGGLNLNSITQGTFVIQQIADLKVDSLSSSHGIRRAGDQIQVVSLDSSGNELAVTATGLLSDTRSIRLSRSGAATPTFLQVDFASGGPFTLPGGIQLIGSADAGVSETLQVIGTGVEAFTVQPSATSLGSGSVLAHGQAISFSNIDQLVTAKSLSVIVEPQTSGNALTFNSGPGLFGATGGTRISGTSGGVQILNVGFIDTPSVTVSTERPGELPAVAGDTITVAVDSLNAIGLKNLFVRTGKGDDNLIVNGPDLALPVAGGAFWYLAGSGSDRLTASADTNYDLNDSRLVSSGGGRIQIDDVEKATLTGGTSNNHLNASLFSGDATLDGAAGADLLRGGFGNDVLFGGTGNDRLYGNDGDDSLNGQDNNDVLFGGNGNDTLNGVGGNDRMFGEEGDDFLSGAAGDDELWGGNGNDNLQGGTQNDRLFGESGDDILNGNEGNDVIDSGSGNDTIDGGTGVDLMWLYGTNNAEDLQLARLSATSATYRRKPRGLTSALEFDSITMDATDEFFIQALDGDDLISVDVALTQLGSIDGGNGTDTSTAPVAWTKVSC